MFDSGKHENMLLHEAVVFDCPVALVSQIFNPILLQKMLIMKMLSFNG